MLEEYEPGEWPEGQLDAMQVCLKGCKITEFYYWAPQERKAFCTDHTEKTPTIFQCPSCHRIIPGNSHSEHSAGAATIEDRPVPKACEYCGEPYPWGKPDYYQMAYDLKEAEKEKKRKHELERLSALGAMNPEIKAAIFDQINSKASQQKHVPTAPYWTQEQVPQVVTNNHYHLNHSQMIQNSPGAVQEVHNQEGITGPVLEMLVALLMDLARNPNLDPSIKGDLEANTQMLEAQKKLSKPDPTLTKTVLGKIWNLVKGVQTGIVNPLLVEYLKNQLGLGGGG